MNSALAFGKYLAEKGWKPYGENVWENSDDDTASTETIYSDFISTYQQSLPSKPVGDVEEMLNKTMFMAGGNTDEQKDYYSLGFKSGYAAAPQKGMKWVKASERLPEIWKCHGSASEKVPIKLYGEFFHVGRIVKNGGRIKFEIFDGKNPTDFESESFHLIEWLDESPSPSEAGDAIEIIDGYTQLAIDKRSLPKDGQHVKFMTENEEFHEGYFVGGDDIFHVTDSKFFFKWHVQQWKGI